jgi:hypothetical protein
VLLTIVNLGDEMEDKEATKETLIAVFNRLIDKEEKLRTETENRLLAKLNQMLDLDLDEPGSHYEGDF